MSVLTIPKASTYGEKDNWQISPEFLRKVIVNARKQGMDDIYEEITDDIIIVLAQMGCVILN